MENCDEEPTLIIIINVITTKANTFFPNVCDIALVVKCTSFSPPVIKADSIANILFMTER